MLTWRPMIAALILLLALPLDGCSWLSGGDTSPAASVRPQTSPVANRPTAAVARGSIMETVKLLGRVSATQEAELSFQTAGRLKKISVQAGQRVSEGQLLAELDTGDLTTRIDTARSGLETAQVRLRQAQSKAGDPEQKRQLDLKTAELAVYKAEDDLSKAEQDLTAAKAGPTPVEKARSAVKDAQAALDSARYNLTITQKSEAVSRNVRDRQNEHNWYESSYGEVLRKFHAGQATQMDVNSAWSDLLGAKERLDSARAQAAQQLEKAEDDVRQAEDKLTLAQADLTARSAVPPDGEVRRAEVAVDAARLALDKAQSDYEQVKQADPVDYDLQLLGKAVEQARLNLSQLEEQDRGSKLIAAFGGQVVGTRGRAGDQVAASQPILTISDPTSLQIRGELAESDVAKVALGQKVSLTIDVLPGKSLEGEVVTVPATFVSDTGVVTSRPVQIRVDWQGATAQLGALARVSIVVRRKDDVLIVPNKAVRTVGKRTFVEYMDGNVRRSANVEIGVVTDDDTEVIAGLKEGQIVLAGQ